MPTNKEQRIWVYQELAAKLADVLELSLQTLPAQTRNAAGQFAPTATVTPAAIRKAYGPRLQVQARRLFLNAIILRRRK